MTAVCFINLADISVGGTVHIHVCHLWNDLLLVFIEILIGSCCIYKEKNNLEDFLQIFVIDVSCLRCSPEFLKMLGGISI